MTFLGMDVDQSRSHADRLRSGQQTLTERMEPLEQSVRASLEHWVGADGDAFRAEWDARVAPRLRETVEGLGRLATDLDGEADAQDEASNPTDGGHGGGGSGGDAPASRVSPKDTGGGSNPALSEEFRNQWDQLSDEDKKAVAEEMVKEYLARYGMDAEDVRFVELDPNHLGTWYESWGPYNGGDGFFDIEWKSRGMDINQDLLNDPDRLFDTLAHEARHAVQHEMIDETNPAWWDNPLFRDDTSDDYARIEEEYGITHEEIDAWRENFDDYKRPEDDFQAYEDQPVEVDAREAGREEVDQLDTEDLERYKDKAGVG